VTQTTTLTNYDANAEDFDQFRQPNPTIVEKLRTTFSLHDGTILSLGCGTGQYEAILSKSNTIVGIDRSEGMIGIAKERISNAIHGDMTSLPFARKRFSGAYFMQSLHHVGANLKISTSDRDFARKKALKEAVRVVKQGPIFIVQRDPSQNQAVWFWKYFPRALDVKMKIQPKIELLVTWLKDLSLINVTAEAYHDPMNRLFYDPRAPLDPAFRRSFSEFSYLSDDDIQIGSQKLRSAIKDGRVEDDIEKSKLRFSKIGGTVFVVSGRKV